MHLDGRQKRFLSSLGLYAALSQNEGYVFNSPSSPLFTDQGVFWTWDGMWTRYQIYTGELPSVLINPLSPNIDVHILLTILFIFLCY